MRYCNGYSMKGGGGLGGGGGGLLAKYEKKKTAYCGFYFETKLPSKHGKVYIFRPLLIF